MIRLSQKLMRSFSRIPLPPNPTMAESFESKVSKEQLQSFMDPRGYLTEDEKAIADEPI